MKNKTQHGLFNQNFFRFLSLLALTGRPVVQALSPRWGEGIPDECDGDDRGKF